MKKIVVILFLITAKVLAQQSSSVSGIISFNTQPLFEATITIPNTKIEVLSDSLGYFKIENLAPGNYKLQVSSMGFESVRKTVLVRQNENLIVNFDLKPTENQLNEVVVSGTLKAVRRLESPVPVEVYSPVFFKKNPTPSIYEALQNVNGVVRNLTVACVTQAISISMVLKVRIPWF